MSKIECNACPVLCQISEGRSGACDRYANVHGVLTRLDPIVLMKRNIESSIHESSTIDDLFVTGVGSGTTYPDYKPAPFIVSSQFEGADTVTVVTEGIFSYCSFRVKIDTDRWLGAERAIVTHKGEAVGHVTTHEYGSQFLSIGGVHHLTGGTKKEGRVTCDLMMALGNKEAVTLNIEGGAELVVQANKAPIVNGIEESRMRVGCGSATIGIFAQQWLGHVDEVVVVDDHITGVLSEHQAGQCLNMPVSGLRLKGRRSTPGRYFQVANPGNGWGGTDIEDPLTIIESWDTKHAKAGMRLLMVSTTGDHSAYFVLDENLVPQSRTMPDAVLKVVERIGENCEPSLCTVLYVGGAGGSLRAGVTDNPIALTQRIKEKLVRVTCGGAPAYVWPGGGITVMVDVSLMPDKSFGSVPTPAIVSPIEFTMKRKDYLALGGHADSIRSVGDAIKHAQYGIKPQIQPWNALNTWPQFPISDA
jgi:6-hydroxynicotinate reductase